MCVWGDNNSYNNSANMDRQGMIKELDLTPWDDQEKNITADDVQFSSMAHWTYLGKVDMLANPSSPCFQAHMAMVGCVHCFNQLDECYPQCILCTS